MKKKKATQRAAVSESSQNKRKVAKKTVRRPKQVPSAKPGSAVSVEERRDSESMEYSKEYVVVGIGASAGGLSAFKEFLEFIPADTGMAFVLIQHLDPNHESMMAEILSKYTSMPVLAAGDAMEIKPNHVYMIPPNKFIKIQDGGLFLDKPVKQRGIRMPIDYFFRSLADQRREYAVGVVLSGTGGDGTQGLREIKAQGGMIMVQEPSTAEYDGMPRSALATGLADFELPIAKMPKAILDFVQHPYVDGGADEDEELSESTGHYKSIISVLRAHTDYDFRCYKRGTLSRRIQRRMGLRHIRKVEDYLRFLRKDSDEVKQLFKDLLISVTAFFREPEAWRFLEKEVIAKIVESKERDEVIRIWVPGCATGEEAYGIGMLVFDQIAETNKNLSLQLFATDLDEDAINRARLALYSGSISNDVPQDRLKKYFTEAGDGRFRVKKRLRESMVFASQNVITDPPFSNLDLISCRNLLIYLEPKVQKDLYRLFHFALGKKGYLFLGASETLGREESSFKELSKHWRIYQKLGTSKPRPLRNPLAANRENSMELGSGAKSGAEASPAELSKRRLLDRFAPPCVVINRNYEIQYYQGAVKNYLEFPSGEPTNNLMSMCAEGLRSNIRIATQRALREEKLVRDIASKVVLDGASYNVTFSAEALSSDSSKDALILIAFEEAKSRADAEETSRESAPKSKSSVPALSGKEKEAASTDAILRQLEHDLQATREDLQSTIEEFETSNEELKASNEEVMSMNEELQSTNEELETSREELQSLNEELSTVNNQLEDKVLQVEDAHNDLSNLLRSTEIATIFLDTDFRIRRFTPASTTLLHVIESDIGRPVSDLASGFNDTLLYDDARKVLANLAAIEREVFLTPRFDRGAEVKAEAAESLDGGKECFIRRILPYRTNDNKIDGVVITYTNITRLRNSLALLETRERQAAVVAEVGQAALAGESIKRLFRRALDGLQATLRSDYSKVLRSEHEEQQLLLVEGVGWKRGLVGNVRVDMGSASQAGFTLQTRKPVLVDDLAEEKRFEGPEFLTSHGILSGISVVIGTLDQPWGILATHSKQKNKYSLDDANFVQALSNILWEAIERSATQKSLKRRLAEIAAIYETAPTGLCFLDREFRYVRLNNRLAEMNKKSVDEHLGRTVREIAPGFADTLEPLFKRVIEKGESILDLEVDGSIEKGELRHYVASYYPLWSGDKVTGVNCVVRDITERKATEIAIRESEKRLSMACKAARLGIFEFDLESMGIEADGRVRELWGFTEKQRITYELVLQGILPEYRSRLNDKLSEAIEAGDEGHFEFEYQYRNPATESTSWLLGTGDIRYKEGEARRLVGVLHDITERKRIEEDLKRADRRKDEFLAMLAHELRNPIAALSTGLEVMKMASDDVDAVAETRDIMGKQIHQLTNLVNDLLDVARYTRNKLELRKATVSIADIVRDAVDASYPQIHDNEHELKVSLPKKEVYVNADAGRMCQVVANLLTNAAKFTERPDVIEVSVKRLRGEKVSIAVKDKGVGLAEKDRASIFDMFSQVEASSGMQSSGLGIGLTLVKGLVEKHDGSISVSSDGVGQGSTFVVTLPRVEPPESSVEKGGDHSGTTGFKALKLLLVDDNEAALRTLSTVLRLRGHSVSTAENGEVAVKKASRIKPDAVIMDLGMPKMDGYQAAKAMKRSKWSENSCFIALSGWGQQKDKEKAFESGFDHHLTKPASIADLEEILSQLSA